MDEDSKPIDRESPLSESPLRRLAAVVREGALAQIRDAMIDMRNPSYGEVSEATIQEGICRALGREFRRMPVAHRYRIFSELAVGDIGNLSPASVVQAAARSDRHPFDIAVVAAMAPGESLCRNADCVGLIEVKRWVQRSYRAKSDYVPDAKLLRDIAKSEGSVTRSDGSIALEWLMLVGAVVGSTPKALDEICCQVEDDLTALGFDRLTGIIPLDPFDFEDMPRRNDAFDRFFDIVVFGLMVNG